MEKSRLFEVFSVLDQGQIKDLRKVVRSPFFNQRDHVVSLFDWLEGERKRGNRQPDRHAAFEHLWPERAFDDHKLRLSMSLLLKTIEQYLIWQRLQADQVNTQLTLGRVYRELGLKRHFVKTMKSVRSVHETPGPRHAEYYEDRYALLLEEYHFNAEHQRMEGFELEAIQENLDVSYLASKLRQSCLMLSHQAIYRKAYDFGMLDAVIEYIERHDDYLQYPAVAIYYHAYRTTTSEAEEELHFGRLKALIFARQESFPRHEMRDLFLVATNYCIKQLNLGRPHYAREGLDLYQEGLRTGILLRQGVLSNFTYSNIVAKAIRTGDYPWARQFVEDYRPRLESKHRDNTYFYNLAWLEYEQHHYDRALTLLNKTNFTDLLLNIAAKTIAMKIYYELEAFELLASHLDAMRTFLHRKKVLAGHQRNYLNTIKYLKKIMDLPPTDRARRLALETEISDVRKIAEKAWLLRQVRNSILRQ